MTVKELIEVLQKCNPTLGVELFLEKDHRSDVAQVFEDMGRKITLADFNSYEKRSFEACGFKFFEKDNQ